VTSPRALAAARTIPVRGNVDANLEQHLRLVVAASEGSSGWCAEAITLG